MSHGPEFKDVEKPFLDQLADLGWRLVTGNVEFPTVTGRGSFREVLLKQDLAKALRRINPRPAADGGAGEPWLAVDLAAQDDAGHREIVGLGRLFHPFASAAILPSRARR